MKFELEFDFNHKIVENSKFITITDSIHIYTEEYMPPFLSFVEQNKDKQTVTKIKLQFEEQIFQKLITISILIIKKFIHLISE